MAVKKTTKRPGLVIYSYLKDGALTAVKGNAKFLNSYVKGAPFVIEGITKWVPFLSKNGI